LLTLRTTERVLLAMLALTALAGAQSANPVANGIAAHALPSSAKAASTASPDASSLKPSAEGPSALDLDAIVLRMEREQVQNRLRTQAYTVEREYQLLGDDDKLLSQVTAAVSYQPPKTKDYSIQAASGSGQGKKLVRKVLEHERATARTPEAAEVSRRNYRFRLLRSERLDGQDCFVLALEPLREDKNLIAGEAWVDQKTFLLRRVEGTPAKSPSWWLKDVRVTMSYAPVGEGDVWLQTATFAEAKVRFFGRRALASRNVCRPGAAVASLRTSPLGCQQARLVGGR